MVQSEAMPGMRGFELAREALGSRVEPVTADFMSMDLAALGTFDVIFYLGVLYHMMDPFLSLRRLRSVTGGVAVIETSIMAVPGYEAYPLWQFFESGQLDRDPTNWWQPNVAALEGMVRAAGFSRVERIVGPPRPDRIGGTEPHQYRAVVHAYP
jgi:tRNA (mo5U34)-methyltransferase